MLLPARREIVRCSFIKPRDSSLLAGSCSPGSTTLVSRTKWNHEVPGIPMGRSSIPPTSFSTTAEDLSVGCTSVPGQTRQQEQLQVHKVACRGLQVTLLSGPLCSESGCLTGHQPCCTSEGSNTGGPAASSGLPVPVSWALPGNLGWLLHLWGQRNLLRD